VTSSASLALSPRGHDLAGGEAVPPSSILLMRSLLRSSSSSSSESQSSAGIVNLLGAVEMPSTMVDERCSTRR